MTAARRAADSVQPETPMLSSGWSEGSMGQAQKTADRVAEEPTWKFSHKARTDANECQGSLGEGSTSGGRGDNTE